MKKVLFVFDRVAHYHRELFKCLENELPSEAGPPHSECIFPDRIATWK